MQTLADKFRPNLLENMVGQEHILSKGKPLYKIIETGNIPNIILFGPPGTGKTTVANIIAERSERKLFKLNGTTASVKDIQEIAKELDTLEGYKGLLIYLDEIHAFSKSRQNSILSYLESGQITLIASTTENPYHSINNALLSRCMLFEFKSLSNSDIIHKLKDCINTLRTTQNITYSEEALDFIASISKGDLRKAISILELLTITHTNEELHIDIDLIKDYLQENIPMDESDYYNWVSMLQKSIRGSDPDASVIALAYLLKSGKMEETIRRLLIIASEDCGLAMGNMYSTFFSLISAAKMVGMPEAQIILSHAVILLATSPKSDSCTTAISLAMQEITNTNIGDIQPYLKDGHYAGAKKLGITGYKYPHDYPNHYVNQVYLPTNLVGNTYYTPGDNKYETSIKKYWDTIKKK